MTSKQNGLMVDVCFSIQGSHSCVLSNDPHWKPWIGHLNFKIFNVCTLKIAKMSPAWRRI